MRDTYDEFLNHHLPKALTDDEVMSQAATRTALQ